MPKTKPKKSAKKVSKKVIEEPIAYTIKDKYFVDLDIMNSDNAWWLDSGKVDRLIAAFKFDATIEEACVYSGISMHQYKYFTEQHPEFSAVRNACRELPSLRARQAVVNKLGESFGNAMDYLKRKKKAEFGDSSTVEVTVPRPLDDVHENVRIQENKRIEEPN